MPPHEPENLVEAWLRSPSASGLLSLPDETQPHALLGLMQREPNRAAAVLVQLLGESGQGRGVLSKVPSAELVRVFLAPGPKVNLRKINWFFLRPFGQFPLLKVSYIALVAIPLASHFPPVFRFGGPYFFPALYFGNLMVALASLLYDIFCPIIIKRFASRNDLYDKMLDIAAKQQQLYPADNWIGTLQHSDEAYKGAAMSGPIKAFLCFLFYLLGFVLLGYVIFERSTAVVRAMLNNL